MIRFDTDFQKGYQYGVSQKLFIMKPVVKIVFDRRKKASKNSNGTVEIEIYQNRKRKWISTGVHVLAHQWKNGLVVGRIDAPDLNVVIQTKYQQTLSLFENGDIDIANISDAHLGKINFLDWLDAQIEARKDIRESTKRAHRQTAQHLRKFGKIQTFADLTTKNIALWDDEIKLHVKKQTSAHGYHKRLKPYIKKAIQLDLLAESPYRKFKVARGRSEGIKYITEAERMRIEELELTGAPEVVRDMFIFACYTGLADCDLRKIVKEDITEDEGKKYIIDKRQKTGDRYKLMLLPKALEILEKYDYNLDLMSNQKCNMYLKLIQTLAGIKTNLTMHVGRHTFATWALKKGVRIEVVSKMLAHTNINTTQIYAKVLQEEVTKGFEQLM